MVVTKHWSLWGVISLYVIIIVTTVTITLIRNQGQLTYPLDDTYIHMAMSKNLAMHGVWGVTRYEFSSSTSSPLWTALLGLGYRFIGVNQALPLVMSSFAGIGCLIMAYRILRHTINEQRILFGLLLFGMLLTPLPTLGLLGMEHALHTLLTLLFGWTAFTLFASERLHPNRVWILIAISPFLSTIRYEGLFLVAVVGGLLLIQRRNLLIPLILGAVAFLPIACYGFWSITQGSLFLPNSLLQKSVLYFSAINLSTAIIAIGYNIIDGSSMWLLLALSICLISHLQRQPQRSAEQTAHLYLNYSFILTAILHIALAAIGWLYRYEAYLMLLGVITVGLSYQTLRDIVQAALDREAASAAWRRSVAQALFGFVLILAFGTRMGFALRDTGQAMHERFLQHLQMANFVKTYYFADHIVLNDLGAIAFFTDARIFDIYGLGSIEPILYDRQIGDLQYTKSDVSEWIAAKQANIAILQSEWAPIKMIIPDQWVHVMDWRMPSNAVFDDRIVSFYAVNPTHAPVLQQQLQVFVQTLPDAVQVEVVPQP